MKSDRFVFSFALMGATLHPNWHEFSAGGGLRSHAATKSSANDAATRDPTSTPQSNTITDRASSPRFNSSNAEFTSSNLIRREISSSSFSRPCM
jgi:hypothetical protein